MPIRAITLLVGICCCEHWTAERLAAVEEHADPVGVGFGDEGEGFNTPCFAGSMLKCRA